MKALPSLMMSHRGRLLMKLIYNPENGGNQPTPLALIAKSLKQLNLIPGFLSLNLTVVHESKRNSLAQENREARPQHCDHIKPAIFMSQHLELRFH